MNCASVSTLVAGHLLSNDSGVASAMMDDVLDSLLYSQFYADKKAKKFDAPAKWFSRFDDAIKVVKWMLSEHQRDAFEPKDNAQISVVELIEEFLLNRLPATQAAAVKSLIDCMAGLPEAEAALIVCHQHVLQRATDAGGHSTLVLQVSALKQETQLSSLSLSFSTTCMVGADPFRQIFPGSSIVGEIDVRFARRDWDYSDYQSVRDKVLGVLAGKRKGLILPISCKAPAGESEGGESTRHTIDR